MMKHSSQRSVQSHEKENLNFLNRLVSPEPSSNAKVNSTQATNMRKNFTTMKENNLCFSRDGREATHFYKDDENEVFKYCEKCSIMLASKGFNIDKLPKKVHQSYNTNIIQSSRNNIKSADRSSERSTESIIKKNLSFRQHQKITTNQQSRLSRVSQIQQMIAQCQQELQSRCFQVQSSLTQSGDNYASIIEQITSYFKIIQQLVEYQKYLAYNRVLSERVKGEKVMRSYKEEMISLVQRLQSIRQDLIENEDAVVTVSNQQFETIMQNYHQIVQSVPGIINLQPQLQSIQSVSLPPIPEVFDQLADSIVFTSTNETNIKSTNSNLPLSMRQNLVQNYERSPIVQLHQNQNKFSHQYHEHQQQTFNQKQSQTISQHSFSNKSVFQRQGLYSNHVNKCPKEILLKDSFSIASSINNNEESFGEQNEAQQQVDYKDQDNFRNTYQQRPSHSMNFYRNHHHEMQDHYENGGEIGMEESLGQYFITEETLMLNQTEQQKNQTLLLNH